MSKVTIPDMVAKLMLPCRPLKVCSMQLQPAWQCQLFW